MTSKVRIGFALLLTTLTCLAMGTSTAGAQVNVGQTVRAPYTLLPCSDEDVVQTSVAEGTGYAMPTAGVLSSWSTDAGPAPGQVMGLKIYRPLGGLAFQVVGQDGPRALVAGQRNTFPIATPVQAGDFLGLFVPSDGDAECRFGQTGFETDFYYYDQENPPNGAVFDFSPGLFGTEERLNIEATLLPPPAIVPLTPPAGTAIGALTDEGCKVPKLKGKKLEASKKTARRSNCRIGKVKKLGDATAKSGKVVGQRPKPGKILSPGAKIKVTLGD